MDRRDWRPLQAMIDRHEGRRRYVYRDRRNLPTIGVGRNLAGKGITDTEMDFLRDNDIADAVQALSLYNWYSDLSQPRQAALVDMMYTLGATKFAEFEKMIAALEQHDYLAAAIEINTSLWHHEARDRAQEIARMLHDGEWPQ